MLTVTDKACDAINTVVAHSDLGEGAGICIAMAPHARRGLVLEISFVQQPKQTDQVLGEQRANVFLEPETVPFLDNKLLDAEFEGNEVTFKFEERA
jgi:Fe-S cluster assembly iron-binding protein IscA